MVTLIWLMKMQNVCGGEVLWEVMNYLPSFFGWRPYKHFFLKKIMFTEKMGRKTGHYVNVILKQKEYCFMEN